METSDVYGPEVAVCYRNSGICHPARLGRETKQREQIGSLAPGFIRQPRSDVVVLIRLPVVGIEIAAEHMGVDVFAVIAEGEVVENVQARRLVWRDLCEGLLCRRVQQHGDCRGGHCHLGRFLN